MIFLSREALEHGGQEPGLQSQVLGHKVSLGRCMTLGRLLGFLGLPFPCLQNGHNITHLTMCYGVNEAVHEKHLVPGT